MIATKFIGRALIILFAFIFCYESYSQAIYFYKIFDDRFPTMRVQWIARQDGGDSLRIPWDQFRITENDISKTETIKMDCGEKPLPETSVLLLIDASTSMAEKLDPKTNESMLDWVRFAVYDFLDSLKFMGDTKVSLVFFANGTKWADGQTPCVGWKGASDVETMKKAIETVKYSPGKTDFGLAFYGTSIRPFHELMNRPWDIQRHMIFITDGEPEVLFTTVIQDSVVKLARRSKTFIHCISIKEPVPQGVQYVTAQTGGARLHATTKAEVRRHLLSLVTKVQRKWLCELQWNSDFTCDQAGINRNISIIRVTGVGTEKLHDTTYKAPPVSVNTMTLSKSQLFFGTLETPKGQNTVTLNYAGGSYQVSGIDFNPHGFFEVKSWGGPAPPFKLKINESRNIVIGYPAGSEQTTSRVVTVNLKVDDYPCKIPQLELVSLCGGTSVKEFNFDTTMNNTSIQKMLNCGFKNRTSIPIEVTAQIKGTNAGEFNLLSQSKQMINPSGCMELEIEFAPKSEGNKSAYIEYTLPENCDTGFKTDLFGTAIFNSVEENYIGAGDLNKLITANPKPAYDILHLRFYIPGYSNTKIELFNSIGVKVETLLDKELNEGIYEAGFSTVHLESGIYFIKISTGNHSDMERIAIIK